MKIWCERVRNTLQPNPVAIFFDGNCNHGFAFGLASLKPRFVRTSAPPCGWAQIHAVAICRGTISACSHRKALRWALYHFRVTAIFL